MTVEALKEVEGITPREAERSKNFFALGLMSWLYGRPIETHARLHRDEVRGTAGARRRQHARVQGGLQLRRDERGLHRLVRGAAGEARAGRLPEHHGQRGAVARPRRRVRPERARPLPRRVPDHAGLRHPRGARALQALRRPHVPGRGRDRGRRRGARRLVRRRARRDDVGRPGDRAEVGDGGARGRARAAARDRRRAARRALDGHADEAGAGRPADGDVRPQLRVARCPCSPPRRRATASTMALEACRIALTYRTPVYLLSDAYLANGSEPWLIPDLEALPDLRVEFATKPNSDGRFLPYVRDRGDTRAPVGAPRDAGPRAPDRRAREGGRHGQRLVRPGQPRRTWSASARRRWPGSPRGIPELEVDDPDGASVLVLGWGGTYGSIAAGVRRVRADGGNVAHAHLRYLNPFPRNTRRGAQALRAACSSRR